MSLSLGAELLFRHEYAEVMSHHDDLGGHWASIRPSYPDREGVIRRASAARVASQNATAAWLNWINSRVAVLLTRAMQVGDKGANYQSIYDLVMRKLRKEIDALSDEDRSCANSAAAEEYERAIAASLMRAAG